MRKDSTDSTESESALLGAILLSVDAQDNCLPVLTEEDFSRDLFRKVFASMKTLYEAGSPIDQVTIRRRGGFTAPDIMDLTDSVPILSNWPAYLRNVRSDARGRTAITVLSAAMAETQAGELGAAKQLVEQVLEPDDEDKLTVYDAPKLFSLSLDIVDSAAQGMANVLGYPSGWPTLDRYIGGLVPGNVVIIAGRPGQGKSAVATNLAVNVAKTGVKVLLFSLEMTAAELGMRMVCRQAKVGWQLLRSGTATADNHRGLVDAAEALSHLPLVVIDHGDVTTTFIRSILRQHQPQVVIIDYVQLMASPGKDSRQQEVAAISRSLKLLAKEQGVCMVALAQLNRNIEMRGGAGASPLLSDLRDSGTLEQDADIVIFAAPRTGNDLELIVAKNRNGQVSTNGEVMLKWTRGLVDIEDPLQAAPHLKVAGA